jgi:hypothetical protein
MTIDNPEVIDLVTYDRTGAVLLVMVEHRSWVGSAERLAQLHAKFDRYLTFIRTGELVERYPFAAGRPLHIELRSYDEPDEATSRTLDEIRSQLSPLGVVLVLKKLRAQAGS